ncbi:importin-4-like [Teleopsis dalmanni]|uniref:importin-4-like n=1 Tax=Teleopsis dalmanni TaxID=139649 RepID=UPI0018CF5D98|nr:importin-4-like [Teleopsis dalmanni]
MEEIIKKLLEADSEVIRQANAELTEAYKHPDTIAILCNIVVSQHPPAIRQYAATLLRRRLAKRRNWLTVTTEVQFIIKTGMLKALLDENEKSVRNAIAQLVGVILLNSGQDMDTSFMEEILGIIYKYSNSNDAKEKELGTAIFAVLSDVAPNQFIPHLNSICNLFTSAMVATEAGNMNVTSQVVLNIIVGMNYLIPFIVGHNAAEGTIQKYIPSIIKTIRYFAFSGNPDEFIRAFDILENIADYTPKLMNNYVKLMLELCIELSQNTELDPAIRIKSVAYIGFIVRLKKKIIIKQKLLEPILKLIFGLMCTEPEDEEDDDEYFLGQDANSPMTTAAQTMDMCALHLPPDKFIPPLLQMLEGALQGPNPMERRGAYLSMAVIAEGCSETICNNYLNPMFEIIRVGLTDQSTLARAAAFFALGQFSEYLQPDITRFAPQILPILFDYMHNVSVEFNRGLPEPKHIDRMFYALETFCEHMEEELVPHLPVLMARIYEILSPVHTVRLREMGFSCVSSIVSAVKEKMLPYFEEMISLLRPYLEKSDDENINALRPQAIDTLASIARYIGKLNFMPLALDTMSFALSLLESSEDPELHRCIYNLLGALSEVVNEQMASVFPKVIPLMLTTLGRPDEECPKVMDDNESSSEGSDEEDIDISQSENDKEDANDQDFDVENPYLDEKEEIIIALKDFAQHSGHSLLPYIERSYEEVYKKLDHPTDELRKVSVETLIAFILCLKNQEKSQAVINAVAVLLKKLARLIQDDENPGVVVTCMDGITDMLKELKSLVASSEEQVNIIYTIIENVMLGKLTCQFEDVDEDDESDEGLEESEFDEAIIETGGNLLPLLGHAVQPHIFDIYFSRIHGVYLKKLLKARKNKDLENQRAFIYGALAECFSPLKQYSAKYFDTMCAVMMSGLTDHSEQARQNALFGLGELVLNSAEKSYPQYPAILNALSQRFANETKPSAVDNVCGAVARLILTSPGKVPLQQVLPVFLQKLPIKEDIQENEHIFKCFQLLLISSRDAIIDFVEQILAIVVHVLYQKQYADEITYALGVNIVNEIKLKYADKFNFLANNNVEMVSFLNSL